MTANTSTRTRPEKRTQAERSAETQNKILEAAVACFSDAGLQNSSTHDVAERAGVSRGAMLHHFPTRTDLLNAAFAHLLEREIEDLSKFSRRISDDGAAMGDLLRYIWSKYEGPLFTVTLDYLALGRIDAEVMAVIEPTAGRFNTQLEDLWVKCLGKLSFPEEAKKDSMARTMLLIRGMAFQNVWRQDLPYFRSQLEGRIRELETRFGLIPQTKD
ncbi:TetR/AcrR family transcriptional regulator [Gymnodinialimonas sp. 2305UL16-5]|uniref:TetR/AcrR family transcriptional regulator n=1 Tax=Gymnodinialimonas mytili TaxID=3126503 RepID=UPI0030A31153